MEAHDRASRGRSRSHFLDGRHRDAVSYLLALHIAARLVGADRLVRTRTRQEGIAGLLGRYDHGHANDEDDGGDSPEHPALSGVAHHLAEHVEQPSSEGESRRE